MDLVTSTAGLINITTTTTTTPNISAAALLATTLVQPKDEEIPVAAIIGAVVVIVGFIIIVLFGSRRIKQSGAPPDTAPVPDTNATGRPSPNSGSTDSALPESGSISVGIPDDEDYEDTDTMERTETWTEDVNRAVHPGGIVSHAHKNTPNYTYVDEPDPRVHDTGQITVDVQSESPSSDNTPGSTLGGVNTLGGSSTTSSGTTQEETTSTNSSVPNPYTRLQSENPVDLSKCTCGHPHRYSYDERESRPTRVISQSSEQDQTQSTGQNSEELDETTSEVESVASSTQEPRNPKSRPWIKPTISIDSQTPKIPISPVNGDRYAPELPTVPERFPDQFNKSSRQGPVLSRNGPQLNPNSPDHLPSKNKFPGRHSEPESRGDLHFKPTKPHSRRDSEPHLPAGQLLPMFARRRQSHPLPLPPQQLLATPSPNSEMPARSYARKASLDHVPQSTLPKQFPPKRQISSPEGQQSTARPQSLSISLQQKVHMQNSCPASLARSQSEPPVSSKEEQNSFCEEAAIQQHNFVSNIQSSPGQDQPPKPSIHTHSHQSNFQGNNSAATGHGDEEPVLVHPPGAGNDTDALPPSPEPVAEQNLTPQHTPVPSVQDYPDDPPDDPAVFIPPERPTPNPPDADMYIWSSRFGPKPTSVLNASLSRQEGTMAPYLSPKLRTSSPQDQQFTPGPIPENGNTDTGIPSPNLEPVVVPHLASHASQHPPVSSPSKELGRYPSNTDVSGMKWIGNVKDSHGTDGPPDDSSLSIPRPYFPRRDTEDYIKFYDSHEPVLPEENLTFEPSIHTHSHQPNSQEKNSAASGHAESAPVHLSDLENGNSDTHTLPISRSAGRRLSEQLQSTFIQDQESPVRTSDNHEVPSRSCTRQTSLPNASVSQQKRTMAPDLSPNCQTSSPQDQQFTPRPHLENDYMNKHEERELNAALSSASLYSGYEQTPDFVNINP